MVTDKIEDLRTRLENIAEELADLTMDMLREALEDGAGERPRAEKPLSQARRAVEKASRLLETATATATAAVDDE